MLACFLSLCVVAAAFAIGAQWAMWAMTLCVCCREEGGAWVLPTVRPVAGEVQGLRVWRYRTGFDDVHRADAWCPGTEGWHEDSRRRSKSRKPVNWVYWKSKVVKEQVCFGNPRRKTGYVNDQK